MQARSGDFVYADPPYAGRHVDYYNSWNEQDEADLISLLKSSPSHFLLSTWHSNKYRCNAAIDEHWQEPHYIIKTTEHFYHVGSTENLRHSMIEALIGNYDMPERSGKLAPLEQQNVMF